MNTEGIMAEKVTMPAALDVPVSLRARAALATIKAQADACEQEVAIHKRR